MNHATMLTSKSEQLHSDLNMFHTLHDDKSSFHQAEFGLFFGSLGLFLQSKLGRNKHNCFLIKITAIVETYAKLLSYVTVPISSQVEYVCSVHIVGNNTIIPILVMRVKKTGREHLNNGQRPMGDC